MEIRNNTPSFGMAFKKPSKEVMQILEKQVDPRSLEAFVKEQAKCKYFDITSKVERHAYDGGKNYIVFNIEPKAGVDTFGYKADHGFASDGLFPDHIKRIKKEYKDVLDDIYDHIETNGNGFQRFCFNKILVPIANFSAMRDMKVLEKKYPERTILPALRAAGDKVLDLEAQVEKASKVSQIFDA